MKLNYRDENRNAAWHFCAGATLINIDYSDVQSFAENLSPRISGIARESIELPKNVKNYYEV